VRRTRIDALGPNPLAPRSPPTLRTAEFAREELMPQSNECPVWRGKRENDVTQMPQPATFALCLPGGARGSR
jgi:hypothetical protein